MSDQITPDQLAVARRAELDAEAHRNAVVRNGGTVVERIAADTACREAAERYAAVRDASRRQP